ncbi:hypothetical protein [Rhizomicrobium electricum]|uniref:hypothetical protein n=1 Tax=Rhizomicrobium electricum TaxID=480070 RepID=UPI001422A1AA|nr:hypothetical protein [Rhizomicrobium electricum]NIJ47884.1 thymidylate kinase [Rhizomicrobium electricum]
MADIQNPAVLEWRNQKPMNLAEFLALLLGELQSRQIRYAIPRNYEKLPYSNTGGDVDIIVHPKSVRTIVALVKSIPRIRLVGVSERSYITNLFLEGVFAADKRVLQVDLIHRLCWRGFDYADVSDILNRSVTAPQNCDLIVIPDPQDEALISLSTMIISAGARYTKYEPRIQAAFAVAPEIVDRRLLPYLSSGLRKTTITAVCDGDFSRVRATAREFCRVLAVSALMKTPVAAFRSFVAFIARELLVRHRNAFSYSLCILGPDGVGKSTVLDAVERVLGQACKNVRIRHLKPVLFAHSRVANRGIVTDPHGLKPRWMGASAAKFVLWLLESWIDRIVASEKNLSIQIFDRYFYDVLVDPVRYRFGGPRILAQLFSVLMPRPQFVLVLDAPAEVIQSRKCEVTFAETQRQRLAYIELAGQLRNVRVVDTNRPLAEVVDDVVEMLFRDMERRHAGFRPSL